MSNSSRWIIAGRLATATVFILAGTFKLLVPFSEVLAQMNVPLPEFAGRAIPLLEIIGGTALLAHRFVPQKVVRVLSLLLAVNMMFAILLVGVPGLLGRAHRVQNHEIGNEAWRVPLEIVLFISTLWFAWRGTNAQSSNQ